MNYKKDRFEKMDIIIIRVLNSIKDPEFKKAVLKLIPYKIEEYLFTKNTLEQDLRGYDCTLKAGLVFNTPHIALRTRSWDKRGFKDITIRNKNYKGRETEYKNILGGVYDISIYYYSYLCLDTGAYDIYIIDMARLGKTQLFKDAAKTKLLSNKDGSNFVSIKFAAIQEAGCLVYNLKGTANVGDLC